MKVPLPVIRSVTWAFGPPKYMKVTPGLSFRAKRGIFFLCSSRKSRFLVVTLLGMTERLDDFRRSAAKYLLFLF